MKKMTPKTLTIKEIDLIINAICAIYEGNYQKDREDFGNGQCIYFAMIIQEIFPTAQICFVNDHYISKINNEYFDFHGHLPSNEEGVFLENQLFPYNKVFPVNNMEDEYDWAECLTIVTKEKTEFYKIYKNALIKAGNDLKTEYLTNIYKRNRTPE